MKAVAGNKDRCGGFIGKITFFLLFLFVVSIYLVYEARVKESDFGKGKPFILQRSVSDFYKFLQQNPSWFILSLLFLPTFGVPLSPLLLIAGGIWSFQLALFVCFLAIGINLIFSYFFYQHCLHRALMKLIFHNRPLRYPKSMTRLTSLRWCFLIQLIPHLPYSAQCYLLANLKEVRFWHYLSISWAFQFAWAVGLISSGKAILSGQWGFTIFGILLIAIYLTFRSFTHFRKMGRKNLSFWNSENNS